jgi:beta-lactamase superfamily II metal-dependent hydrolase
MAPRWRGHFRCGRFAAHNAFLIEGNPAGLGTATIGSHNVFGFPASEVIERCVARKTPVHRTDLHGAVHAVSDGLKWTITTESDRNINAQKNRER